MEKEEWIAFFIFFRFKKKFFCFWEFWRRFQRAEAENKIILCPSTTYTTHKQVNMYNRCSL